MNTIQSMETSLGLDLSAAPLFPFGYYHFHDDVSLNFQFNRWLTWIGDSAIPDLRGIAPRIHDYDDWKREFLQLANDVLGADKAQSHCQHGNKRLVLDVILGWLNQISHRPPPPKDTDLVKGDTNHGRNNGKN